MLCAKIEELESKLKNKMQEVESLESKIHMLCQSESS